MSSLDGRLREVVAYEGTRNRGFDCFMHSQISQA